MEKERPPIYVSFLARLLVQYANMKLVLAIIVISESGSLTEITVIV